jgi:hypothetical protein
MVFRPNELESAVEGLMHPLPHFMIPEVVAVGALIFLLCGLFLCNFGAKNQRKYDFLTDPPLVCISAIPRGFVHVRGKAVIDNPLTSPLTQMPCCYYRTTIERLEPGKRGKSGTCRKLSNEPNAREFYIDDGTGKALVSLRGAEYEFPKIYSAEIDTQVAGIKSSVIDPSLGQINSPTEHHLRQYLAQHGIAAGIETPTTQKGVASTGGVYQLTEYCLLAGQEASVFGTCDQCYGPESPHGCKVLCLDEHLPTFLITNRNEFSVGPRLRHIAIACFTSGIIMIGVSLAGILLLIYPRFV